MARFGTADSVLSLFLFACAAGVSVEAFVASPLGAPPHRQQRAGTGRNPPAFLRMVAQQETTPTAVVPVPLPGTNPPPEELPPGWESTVDPESGYLYYFNRFEGASSWEPPSSSGSDSDLSGPLSDLADQQVQQTPLPVNDNSVDVALEPVTDKLREELGAAVAELDSLKVTELLTTHPNLHMDEATTEGAFWKVVQAVDKAEQQDKPLSADIPRMLHHIFDADHHHLLTREKISMNMTCMQPAEGGLNANAMNYIFDDSSHKDLSLIEGRRCEDGRCCDACSRNIFPTFATENEINFDTFPEIFSLTFNELETVKAATIIQFARLVERVRRTMAHEYGLPLNTLLPLQAYSRKYVAGTTQQGGGGGEGDMVTLHTDEATHQGYHYSCVIYLSTQGEDFEGGDFVFNDPDPEAAAKKKAKETDDYDDEDDDELEGLSLEDQIRRAGRKLTPFHPTRGAAVIFSSGWENMHEVERITSGTRYAVPCFFTTSPVPELAYEQMAVGKPKTDEDIADDWLHLLLAHRQEEPQQAVGRVKELLMKWHYMMAPLSMH